MKNILIFDMDGTLINSSKDITSSINYVRDQKGMSSLPETDIAKAINADRKKLPYILYGTETYTSIDRERFEKHYNTECTKTSHVYEGIIPALHQFADQGYHMSVATNAPTFFAEKMLKHTNIIHFFDHIIGACKVETPKPAPDMIHLILDAYDVKKPIDCKATIIGDNNVDIDAGINAGIHTVFANWGFGDSNRQEDLSLASPSDLYQVNSFYSPVKIE